MNEEGWYSERRARWRPQHIRLLLVAESAPDSTKAPHERRFFYDERLTQHDGLFREVVRVLFDNPPLVSGPTGKTHWLERLRDDGVFLIDLAGSPVNALPRAERAKSLKQNTDATVAHIQQLNPDGIVLIKNNVFDMLHEPLLKLGLPLLHREAIPFPGSGWQKHFRERFEAAVKDL